MFSYLHGMRPNSRRSALPPATLPQHVITTRLYHDSASNTPDHPQLLSPSREPDTNPPPISSRPPVLPPIPRVASQHGADTATEARTQLINVEEKGIPTSIETVQGRSANPGQRGIRPRGLSVEDPPQEIARSRTMPDISRGLDSYERGQESLQDQQNFIHTIVPPKTQRYSKTNQKTSETNLPLPKPNRQPSKSPPPPQPPLHVRSQTNPAKQAKTKLNLLNPMSLLARRRSSQAVLEASRDKHYRTENTNVPALKLPDNYDPRIRGKGVHDFDSTQRPGRSGPHSEAGTPPKSANGQEANRVRGPIADEDSPSSSDREHTPIFKEHFEDGTESWQEGREGPTKRPKSGFMYKVALQEPGPRPDPSNLPAFARHLPSSFPSDHEPLQRVSPVPRPPLQAALEAALSKSLPKVPSVVSSPPTSPPSKPRSGASSSTDLSFIPAGLPKHFKSNASRFSFDSAGVGSTAQEQLLEEKHRQKAKARARASAGSAKTANAKGAIDDDEDFDLDDPLSDDGGLEERIPGINADFDDDHFEEEIPGVNADAVDDGSPVFGLDLGELNAKVPANAIITKSTSPKSEGELFQDTPQQYKYNPAHSQQEIGSKGEAGLQQICTNGADLPLPIRPSQNIEQGSIALQPTNPTKLQLPELALGNYDDDMYFDDGMIEDMEEDLGPAFDESQFDDETSRIYGVPIRDLPKSEPIGASLPGQDDASAGENPPRHDNDDGSRDETIAEELRDSLPDLGLPNRPIFSHTAGLTQDNLAAYHDALALAANQAALDGKFVRQQSLQSQRSYPLEGPNEDLERAIPVGESPSLEINGLPLSGNGPTNDDYDFDDALSDDPIIAAANAEALENDDDGFYGQEFGFFARANGSGEYVNGGYFGQGIMRSHSGRNADVALTPITERSEWSNRNSAINLALNGYSQVSLPQPSPGLAQLADMMQLEEDNMSLSALMKLRRGAWGASTTSLQSSSGTSGSPLTYLPPMPSNDAALQYQQQQGSYPPVIMQQGLSNSTYSLNSSNGLPSDESSTSDQSHTITLSTLQGISLPPNPVVSAPFMQPSYSNTGSEVSPVQSRPRSGLVPKKGNGHSRHNSGGDSVSYMHERDQDGERWVLEKRRIGEGGVVEVLGREIVEGGRI